jgi:hypothetical protein
LCKGLGLRFFFFYEWVVTIVQNLCLRC